MVTAMNWQDFIKPELLVLIPVLYFVGMAIKQSPIKDALIPLLLGAFGVSLSMIYVLATAPVDSIQAFFTGLFTALTQGLLCAAAAVYSDQVIKQAIKANKEENEEKEDK